MRALRRSLPRSEVVAGAGPRQVLAAVDDVLRRVTDAAPVGVRRDLLATDVDVVVGGRLLARRRQGRWAPSPTVAAGAGATAAAAVGVVTGVLLAVVAVVRRVLRPRG
ncbi:hypothetical protein [Aquipuribacter nitratireducens]|uniref:Uncharacterized protein n=1 Tax=Aquipuribacter nitratireducens TaxID=650104 RepID=A0ABW0GJ28_9MICO